MKKAIHHLLVSKYSKEGFEEVSDHVSVEEPLEIIVAYGSAKRRQTKSISVTMRTPDGNDSELALGFLFSEGLIHHKNDVLTVKYAASTLSKSSEQNIIRVELSEKAAFNPEQLNRHFYAASSCGICGKSSIEMVQQNSSFQITDNQLLISKSMLFSLPKKLKEAQEQFLLTGGIHASFLYNLKENIGLVKEDIGRHNALDKIIGCAFQTKSLPLQYHLLVLSGRLSFELVQKAWMAGIPIIAAIGAPSSLAIELAEEVGITLIGFLKEDRFNVYSHGWRVGK